MTNLIIFDADSIIWTIAYKFRNKKVRNLLLLSLNSFITEVVQNAKATHYIGFFGAKGEGKLPNFRYAIDPNYKKQRPPEPDWITKWRPIITDEMADKWGFQPVEGMEADDAVAICANNFLDVKVYDKVTVATVDKDLKQIPNVTYYNYGTHESIEQTEMLAITSLGEQLLKGDSTDNIKGLYNIGNRKAKNIISVCNSPVEVKWTVMRMYKAHEDEMRKKITVKIIKKVKEDLKDTSWEEGKSEKQISRKIRLDSKALIEQELEAMFPGGWKAYYKMQYELIHLKTEPQDFFIIPIPRKNKLELPEEANDDFLYDI